MHFLKLMAAINALPNRDRVYLSALGRLGLHIAPITVVEAVSDLDTGNHRISPLTGFKGLVFPTLARAT